MPVPEPAPIDPIAALDSLGAKWSPAFSRPGPLVITARNCVLCSGIECECAGVEFGSDRYFAKLDKIHGRTR